MAEPLYLHRGGMLLRHPACESRCSASPACPSGVCARAATPLYIERRLKAEAECARMAGACEDQGDTSKRSPLLPASGAISAERCLRSIVYGVIGILALIGAVSLARWALR